MGLSVSLLARVYPRVCGGTQHVAAGVPAWAGLSPRVRGNRAWRPVVPLYAGSIPACAGEPRLNKYQRELLEVYPRVCGGTCRNPRHAGRAWGLSPRVRGNPILCCRRQYRPGSIPACAGEPGPLYPVCSRMAVYPRVCGGTAS